MKTLNINDKTFQFKSDVFKFLHDYLERINAFVSKNQIDAELYQDILQIFEEKLSACADTAAMNQKEAIQIVNALGEPEEIFAESLEYAKKEEKTGSDLVLTYFYERLQHEEWSRPQQKAFFLGVLAMFAEKIGVNVRILRGLPVLAVMFGLGSLLGILFFGYFLCALIFPRAEKNYAKRSVFNYFLTQIWDFRLLFVNSFRQIWTLLSQGAPKGIGFLGKIFWMFWKLVRVCVLIFRCCGMFGLIVGLAVLLYALLTGIVRENVDITSVFPAVMKRGVMMGILSAVGFFAVGVLALMREKIKGWILISAFVLGAGALSIAGVSFVELLRYKDWSYVELLQKQISVPISGKNHSLQISIQDGEAELMDPSRNLTLVDASHTYNFIPTDEKEIRVVFNYSIQARGKSDPKLTQIKNNLSSPVIKFSGDSLDVKFFKDQMFTQITPFLPISMSVDFYIPKDIKFTFSADRDGYYHSNLKKPDWVAKYGGYGPCVGDITYQVSSNAFYCDMHLSQADKKLIIQQELPAHLDKIAPFLGTNWEYSFMQRKHGQYWRLHSMRWLDDQNLLVKLSDKFFNLFLKVKVDLDNKQNLIIDHVYLQDLEQKGLMNEQRLKAYDKLSQVSGFVLNMQDERQELLSRISELQDRLEILEAENN